MSVAGPAIALVLGASMILCGLGLILSVLADDAAVHQSRDLEIRLREAGYKFAPRKDAP